MGAHYGKSLDDLMEGLPSGPQNIDLNTQDLKGGAFSADVWAFQRKSGGVVNLLHGSAYNGAIRDAWYDAFSEHNNWTQHEGKLCTETASGFRDLLTNTLAKNDPQGPFVAGFDQFFNGADNGGNPPAIRSNRVGWENPRCTSGGTNYAYSLPSNSAAMLGAAGTETVVAIAGADEFIGAGTDNAYDNRGTPPFSAAYEGGSNWGAQYRG